MPGDEREATAHEASLHVPPGAASFLVSLMYLHLFLANSTLKVIQVGAELLLGVFMLVPLLRCRFTLHEIAIVFAYGAALIGSLMVNDITVALLNAKIYGLGILTLFFFSRAELTDRVTPRVIALNIALSIYLYVLGAPGWFVVFVNRFARSWVGLADSRPLGIFLSTHSSAFVTAVALLYLSYRRRAFIIPGFAAVFCTLSWFTLVSYAGQLGANVLEKLRLAKPLYALIGVAVPLAFLNADRITHFDITTLGHVFGSREQLSYAVIIAQVLDWHAYAKAFTLFPRDTNDIVAFFTNQGNEIGYFTVLQQGGVVLTALYLWRLFERVRGFRIFFALSMLHYGMATTPISVYLMVHLSVVLGKTRLIADRRAVRVDTPPGHVPPAFQ